MVKGRDRVDDWLDPKVEKKRSRKIERQRSRTVEKQRSAEVEDWKVGKTQVSYWLSDDVVKAIHDQAFKEKRSKSKILEDCVKKYLR